MNSSPTIDRRQRLAELRGQLQEQIGVQKARQQEKGFISPKITGQKEISMKDIVMPDNGYYQRRGTLGGGGAPFGVPRDYSPEQLPYPTNMSASNNSFPMDERSVRFADQSQQPVADPNTSPSLAAAARPARRTSMRGLDPLDRFELLNSQERLNRLLPPNQNSSSKLPRQQGSSVYPSQSSGGIDPADARHQQQQLAYKQSLDAQVADLEARRRTERERDFRPANSQSPLSSNVQPQLLPVLYPGQAVAPPMLLQSAAADDERRRREFEEDRQEMARIQQQQHQASYKAALDEQVAQRQEQKRREKEEDTLFGARNQQANYQAQQQTWQNQQNQQRGAGQYGESQQFNPTQAPQQQRPSLSPLALKRDLALMAAEELKRQTLSQQSMSNNRELTERQVRQQKLAVLKGELEQQIREQNERKAMEKQKAAMEEARFLGQLQVMDQTNGNTANTLGRSRSVGTMNAMPQQPPPAFSPQPLQFAAAGSSSPPTDTGYGHSSYGANPQSGHPLGNSSPHRVVADNAADQQLDREERTVATAVAFEQMKLQVENEKRQKFLAKRAEAARTQQIDAEQRHQHQQPEVFEDRREEVRSIPVTNNVTLQQQNQDRRDVEWNTDVRRRQVFKIEDNQQRRRLLADDAEDEAPLPKDPRGEIDRKRIEGDEDWSRNLCLHDEQRLRSELAALERQERELAKAGRRPPKKVAIHETITEEIVEIHLPPVVNSSRKALVPLADGTPRLTKKASATTTTEDLIQTSSSAVNTTPRVLLPPILVPKGPTAATRTPADSPGDKELETSTMFVSRATDDGRPNSQNTQPPLASPVRSLLPPITAPEPLTYHSSASTSASTKIDESTSFASSPLPSLSRKPLSALKFGPQPQFVPYNAEGASAMPPQEEGFYTVGDHYGSPEQERRVFGDDEEELKRRRKERREQRKREKKELQQQLQSPLPSSLKKPSDSPRDSPSEARKEVTYQITPRSATLAGPPTPNGVPREAYPPNVNSRTASAASSYIEEFDETNRIYAGSNTEPPMLSYNLPEDDDGGYDSQTLAIMKQRMQGGDLRSDNYNRYPAQQVQEIHIVHL